MARTSGKMASVAIASTGAMMVMFSLHVRMGNDRSVVTGRVPAPDRSFSVASTGRPGLAGRGFRPRGALALGRASRGATPCLGLRLLQGIDRGDDQVAAAGSHLVREMPVETLAEE